MVFGESREGGSHLAALGRAVPRQVVCIVVAQAEEALQAGTAVVWPCPVIAMGQQQHQTGLLAPPLLPCTQQSYSQQAATSGTQSQLGSAWALCCSPGEQQQHQATLLAPFPLLCTDQICTQLDVLCTGNSKFLC